MEKDAFIQHPLWQTLIDIEAKLTEVDSLGDPGISSKLDELRLVRAYSVSLFEADQVFLIASSSVDELNTWWTEVRNDLSNYLQVPSGNQGYLENARAPHLDQVRHVLAKFPRFEEFGAKKAASTRAATAYAEQLESSRDFLAQEISRLTGERDAQAEDHRVELENMQATADELRARLSDLQSRITSDEDRLSKTLIETNAAFATSQTERNERFGKWLEQQEEHFDEEAQPQYTSIMAAATRAEEALAKVTSLQTSVEDMADLASGDILGGQYKKSARSDRVAGYIGYVVGIFAGIAGAWVLIAVFGEVGSKLEWPQVALKLGLTTGIGGIAAVAFRFGGQSLARATAFKRQELELRALTPFLNGVTGSDEAKLAFVRQSFGRAWDPDQKADKSSPMSESVDFTKTLDGLVEIANKTIK